MFQYQKFFLAFSAAFPKTAPDTKSIIICNNDSMISFFIINLT